MVKTDLTSSAYGKATPDYAELLLHSGSQLPALLRLLALSSGTSLLSIGNLPCFEYHHRYCLILLYRIFTLHPPLLRIPARHFRPQTPLPLRLLYLHDDFCRIHVCRSASARRGEGLGYYGLANNLAMSIGPMFGLFLHSAGTSYIAIFSYGLGSCVLGFIAASMVKTPYKPPVKREPISLDRFILIKGLPAGLSPHQRIARRTQLALAIYPLRHDHQLCSHVCQANRYHG